MSISPKLSNSTPPPERDSRWAERHELHRHAPEVIRRLMAEYDCQLKFVVDCPDGLPRGRGVSGGVSRDRAQPGDAHAAGRGGRALAEKAAWLAPYCAAHGLSFCPRRQIEWFGAQRGR